MNFLLILMLLSFSAFAQRNPTITSGLRAIANPSSLTPQADCAEAIANGSPLPAHCRDLYASVCSIQKSSTQLRDLDQSIANATYNTLPATATQAQRNQAADQAIRMSDSRAYDNNAQEGLSRDDVRRLMDPARWNVISLFNGVGTNPSPAAQRQMTATVQNIHLVSGSEYVASLIQWGRQQNPGANIDTLRQNALTTYTAACGRTGLEVNAFFEDGNVILCPGLAYSMRDYGSENKLEEMKAAMIFTMSHEITHSIDYLVNSGNYSNLIACYRKNAPDASVYNSNQKLAELTSDYYGAYSLGKYLQDNASKLQPATTASVLRILARSVGSYCTEIPGDTDHPAGRFRINQVLARAPGIKSALGCPAPTAENPSCSLRGEIPPNPVR